MGQEGGETHMSKVSAWWLSLGFGKGERRPDTDYGDMGTAFGLDASFGRDGVADSSVTSGTGQSPRGLESIDGHQGVVPRKGPARP
jgi:hypothetical protein